MDRPPGVSASLSRRRFLLTTAIGAATAGLALTGAPVLAATSEPNPTEAPTPTESPSPTPAPPTPQPTPSGPPPEAIVAYRSRPDLRPPVITVEATSGAGDDLMFVTPRFSGEGEGVMAFDANGLLVWLHRVPGRAAAGLRPIRYRDEPALSWWEGTVERGLGDGDFVIVDRTYREVARVRAVARPTDLHELLVTPDDTAYLFAVDVVDRDGQLIDDMLVQEVDVRTGRLLWEWRFSDHVGLDESVQAPPDEGPWDYAHLNSIDLDLDGDLIVSARHTDAIYKVSRRTGEVVWRLGGTRSDFELAPRAVFRRQHDARRQADGTISLFDNATQDAEDDSARSRGLVLRLDEVAGTAELVRELMPPRRVISASQGNLEIDDDGRATIGWGSANLITSYDATGAVTFDAAMPAGFSSYRAYRAPWRGRPVDSPLLAIGADESGRTMAWASWNGATGVTEWQLLAGPDARSLRPVAERVPRNGFETAIRVPDGAAVVAVRALDRRGRRMGQSLAANVASAAAEATPVA